MNQPGDLTDHEVRSRRVDRRRFLTTFALGAGLAPVISLSQSLGARRQAAACYTSKRVIGASDFSYLGAMRLPLELSSFSRATLAGRRVNGQLRFFMTGENSPNAVANWGCLDCVWEFGDTGSYSQNYATAPRATTITRWGDIFQGKRVSWLDNGQQISLEPFLLTSGIYYKNDRLYWTYFDVYNVGSRNDWCLGMTQLNGAPANMQAYGPWRPNIGVKHAGHWIVEMPNGSMGLGSTLISGNVHSSWGPELNGGAPFPTPTTPAGFGAPDVVIPQTYVRYAWAGAMLSPEGGIPPGMTLPSLLRDGNYVWHSPAMSPGGAGVVVQANPLLNGGVGSWTDLDYVQSCVYIDLPEKHGILFPGMRATGHVWYGLSENCGHGLGNPCGGGTGPNATGYEPRWWIYDPEQCMRVATGHLSANLTPASQFNPATALSPLQLGCGKSFGGTYFDAQTRRLYVGAYQADDSVPGLLLPLIHVYQISS